MAGGKGRWEFGHFHHAESLAGAAWEKRGLSFKAEADAEGVTAGGCRLIELLGAERQVLSFFF